MRSHAILFAAFAIAATALALSGCGGGESGSDVASRTAHLYQAAAGQDPVIRMSWSPSSATDPTKIVAWLIYRASNFGLAAEPANLISVQEVHGGILFEDTLAGTAQTTFNRSFTYFRLSEQQTGTVNITYTHPALTDGTTYHYRARLVVKPHSGSPPISSASASAFEVDPDDALTDPSLPQGPVTYFAPPTQTSPANGSTSANPTYIQFRWNAVAGATEYQVRVYSTSSATGIPVLQSPAITPIGGFAQWTYDAGSTMGLNGGRPYYWVVGARAAGETTPACGTETGWLRSAIRQFTPVTLPPGV